MLYGASRLAGGLIVSPQGLQAIEDVRIEA